MKNYLIIVLCIVFLSCTRNEKNDFYFVSKDSLELQIKRKIEEKKRIDQFKKDFVRSRYMKGLLKYKPIIKKYSKRYGFDWRLIVAQIMQESKFREKAQSHVGARGLMQIMPKTAQELSKELDIQYILKNPRENIAAGIYHMKKQFNYFPGADYANRTKLSLASYNCGVGRVFDAQDMAKYFRKSPNNWKNVKNYIGKLKSENWEIHLQVWPQGKPRYGYFYGDEETKTYVDNIWAMYQLYMKIL